MMYKKVSLLGLVAALGGCYELGGELSGLEESHVVLEDGQGNALHVADNGRFTFEQSYPHLTSYAVTVAQQPEDHRCEVSNGEGAVNAGHVDDIAVSCTRLSAPGTYTGPWFPVNIENNSGPAGNKWVGDDQVYIIAKAKTPGPNAKHCFVKVTDFQTGESRCEVVTAGTDSSQYAFKLADLRVDTLVEGVSVTQHQLKLPLLQSGRLYVSLEHPVDFDIVADAKTGEPTIADPDGFNNRDGNYYYLFDKVEFSFTANNGSWANPTAVDFFSLPLALSQQVPDNSVANNCNGSAGGGCVTRLAQSGLTASRSAIFSLQQQVLSSAPLSSAAQWDKLSLTYTPTTGASSQLRIVSPSKAMADTGAYGNPSFDTKYLHDASQYGIDYLAELENYYAQSSSHRMVINTEADLKNNSSAAPLNDYLFTGYIDAGFLVFNNQTQTKLIRIKLPNSAKPYFGGAGESFDQPKDTPESIIVREFTSAVVAGLMPYPELLDSSGQALPLSKPYFAAAQAQGLLYQQSLLPASVNTGPWYDLYSKGLHSIGGASSVQPIYTFAYDDALAQDGTLNDDTMVADSTTASGKMVQPHPLTISLGDLTNTVIPQFADSTLYHVGLRVNALSTVTYENGQPAPFDLANVQVPLTLLVNGEKQNIYFSPQRVTPSKEGVSELIVFQAPNAGDQQLGIEKVVNIGGSNMSFPTTQSCHLDPASNTVTVTLEGSSVQSDYLKSDSQVRYFLMFDRYPTTMEATLADEFMQIVANSYQPGVWSITYQAPASFFVTPPTKAQVAICSQKPGSGMACPGANGAFIKERTPPATAMVDCH
ncbi:beta-1,3-glucanase [Sinobacterium caligoides]|uniref:Beta-1,3-glucanase n=1 Tax=Sinobacterium caligoides TaxID=933926 RepID=A0A3N2DPN5_9GAMM|nr:beta-1,3-glucanase family protein [Sinobacterium caligoides]ROS01767.1 beta-1,3-glucanase [Sinobacterium caligoides]